METNKAQENRHPAVQVTALALQHNLAKKGGCFALGWSAKWAPNEYGAVKVAILTPPAATLAMALSAKKELEQNGYIVREVKPCGSDRHAYEIHFSVAKPTKAPSALNICREGLWESLGNPRRTTMARASSSPDISQEVA